MADVTPAQALELIEKAQKIMIAPSTPDGDSIGSALALLKVLEALGKQVTVVVTQEIPVYLRFLPFVEELEKEFTASKDFIISLSTEGAEVDHLKYEVDQGRINIIITPKAGTFKPADVLFDHGRPDIDLIITVDTGDLVQLGDLYEKNKEFFHETPLLNLDHHASNGRFGTHNCLDFSVSATTQMLTPLMYELERKYQKKLIDEDLATLLLTGIITDTGSFQHSNTTPEAFEVAAGLLERGARQQEIIKHIFKTKSLATLKLWGRVLSKIQYEDALVYSTITLQDLADTGANSEDNGGIIDELMSNAPGAEVVVLLKEKEAGFINGSMRAPGSRADVSAIAGTLGGGGHKKAAGFRIRGKSMDEALAMVKAAVQAHLGQAAAPTPAPAAPTASDEDPNKLFPGLVVRPQTSIPKPSPGGEDLLLQDFRNRDKTVAFFQDADGQVKPAEPTVGEVLSQLGQ